MDFMKLIVKKEIIISLKISKNDNFWIYLKIINFTKNINKFNPDIIQDVSFKFYNIIFQRKIFYKLFWNIRHSELNFKISKKQTIFISIICGIFSKIVPRKIIYCSDKSIKISSKSSILLKKNYY